MNDIPFVLEYCPFCGGTNLLVESEVRTEYRPHRPRHCFVFVCCKSCGARGPIIEVDMPFAQYNEQTIYGLDAKKEWNTRYQEKELLQSFAIFKKDQSKMEAKMV